MSEDSSYLKNLSINELVYLAKTQLEGIQKNNEKILDTLTKIKNKKKEL